MWFIFYSYPFSYLFVFLLTQFNYKLNNLYFTNQFLKLNFLTISGLITIVNMRRYYNYLLISVLDLLINVFQRLPTLIRFHYRYRKHKYLEICIIKFSLNFKDSKQVGFKLLTEIFFFLIKNYSYEFNNSDFKLKKKINKLIFTLDLKSFKYYLRFLDVPTSLVKLNFSLDLKYDNIFFSKLGCLFYFRFLKNFFNNFKNVY